MKFTYRLTALSLALLTSAAFGGCHNGSCSVKYSDENQPEVYEESYETETRYQSNRPMKTDGARALIVAAPVETAGTIVQDAGQGVAQVVERPVQAAGNIVQGATQGAANIVEGVGEGISDLGNSLFGN